MRTEIDRSAMWNTFQRLFSTLYIVRGRNQDRNNDNSNNNSLFRTQCFVDYNSMIVYPNGNLSDYVLIGSVRFPINKNPKTFVQIGQSSTSGKLQSRSNSTAAAAVGGAGVGAYGGSKLRGPLLKCLETVASSVALRLPVLFCGASGSGKRRTLYELASLTGNTMVEYSATTSTDSTDLLGSFEQSSVYISLCRGVRFLEKAALLLVELSLYHSSPLGRSHHRNSYESAEDNRDTPASQLISECLELVRLASLEAVTVEQDAAIQLDAGSHLFESLQKAYVHMTTVLESFTFDDIREAMRVVSVQNPSSSSFSSSSSRLEEQNKLIKNAKDSLQQARISIDKCHTYCTTKQADSAGFVWTDGLVVRALQEGWWLLIDNVNLCSASVLDRLNSLLEPNGSILLTECGLERHVKASENFRIFFTMDPSYGEISRAMRNRCVEVATVLEAQGRFGECLHEEILSKHVVPNGWSNEKISSIFDMYNAFSESIPGPEDALIINRSKSAQNNSRYSTERRGSCVGDRSDLKPTFHSFTRHLQARWLNWQSAKCTSDPTPRLNTESNPELSLSPSSSALILSEASRATSNSCSPNDLYRNVLSAPCVSSYLSQLICVRYFTNTYIL